MIRLLVSALNNQKAIISLFIFGLILILLTLPLALVSLNEAMTNIEEDITEHARGSYDILIRPEGARNQIEEDLGLVEENYLTVGNGGISINDWKEIRDMEEVEVAAPVASLGYYTGVTKSFATWMPTQSTRAQVKYYTSDGIHRYPIYHEVESVGFLLEQESVPQRIPEYDVLSKNYAIFSEWYPPMFMLPNTYHFMVGVHPESEELLTGISFDNINQPLSEVDRLTFEFAGDADIINVMKLGDVRVPLEADIVWEYLDFDKEQTTSWKEEIGLQQDEPFLFVSEEHYNNLFEKLLSYPSIDENLYSIDLKEAIIPFEYNDFMITENLTIAENEYGYHGSLTGTTQFYFADPVNYSVNQGGQIYVRKLNDFSGVPVYREVTEQGGDFSEIRGTDVPFILNPTGEFSILELQDSLSASPLGIYQLAPITLKETENGEQVTEPIELLPTIYPGSFVSTPAHGIISLEAAEVIKGESPIDAIRVRVANIDAYTSEAQGLMTDLADRFLQMGYEVDIVAGASYQELDVFVEGVGLVSQPWTTLGAAAAIISGWSGTSFLLSIIFSLTAIIYVLNRLYFYWQGKVKDITTLLQLGWDNKHIKQLYRRELLVIILFAWVVSCIGLLIFTTITDHLAFKELLQWNVLLSVMMAVSVLGSVELKSGQFMSAQPKSGQEDLRNLNNRTIDESTRTKVKPVKRTYSIRSGIVEKISLSWQSIRYFLPHIYSTMIQIAIVSALATFVYLSIYSTVEQTNITILGQYVNFRIGTIHIVMLISAYTLATLTIIESLSSLYSMRQSEIKTFLSVGWENKHILGHWLREVSFWSVSAVLLGHIIGGLVFTFFYPFSMYGFLVVVMSMIGFFLFIMLLATILLYRFLSKMGGNISNRDSFVEVK